jgi:hypothetical protein
LGKLIFRKLSRLSRKIDRRIKKTNEKEIKTGKNHYNRIFDALKALMESFEDV